MKRSPGFTLIEILLVLAIIGVLMAVLIPNVTGARQAARRAAAATYGSNVYSAVNTWLTIHPTRLPVSTTVNCAGDFYLSLNTNIMVLPGRPIDPSILNWEAPTDSQITCSLQFQGRTVTVTTRLSGDAVTYVNGKKS